VQSPDLERGLGRGTDDPFAARDLRVREFLQKNPQATFAQYMMEKECQNLLAGKARNPAGALAVATGDSTEFWKSGEAKAAKLIKLMALKPHHKVIEYGCGSLRLGGHLIRYLNRGGFFGLDVISCFYEIGMAAIGAELIEKKAPHLRVIDEPALAEAAGHSADFVFSNAVCFHVHPDEIQTYFQNLTRLVHRRGARLFFSAELSDLPQRNEYARWSWPLEFYKKSLSELELVRASIRRTRDVGGTEIKAVEFEFRRG